MGADQWTWTGKPTSIAGLRRFVAALRHKTRARMCPFYVAGLIGPGDRKSVQPMAARASEVGYDQLHHFVAAGVWGSGANFISGRN